MIDQVGPGRRHGDGLSAQAWRFAWGAGLGLGLRPAVLAVATVAARGKVIQRAIVWPSVLLRERFAQVIVHAGRQARFAVALQRIGRDGDDGQHWRSRGRSARSWRRISAVAAKPSITGIWQSIRIEIEIGSACAELQGFFAVDARRLTSRPRPVEHGAAPLPR